jgi:hypothetical protein
MTDTLSTNAIFAIDWFRVKIDNTPNEAVRKSQQQSIDSFSRFLNGVPIRFEDITEDLLNEWLSWLFCHGYSHGTALTYTLRLSALYGKAIKEGLIIDNGCFAAVKSTLKSASKASLEVNSLSKCFNMLRQLVLTDYSKNQGLQLAKDLVLFSLYNGGLSYDQLAQYKKDDYNGHDEAVKTIVDKYSKPKNKYLFPLHQSERTPNQLKKSVSSLFSDALNTVGIRLSSYDDNLPTDLWALTALRCGIPSADIAGCIGIVDNVNPVYSFAKSDELSAEQKEKIYNHVSRILSKNPEDWYAMQFRPHVNYERIKDRLKSVGIIFSKSFYPMEEIVRRIDKKLIRESRPVIPGLLFFKKRATELPELFFHIGDIAWGYRCSRSIHSPYAIIPQKSIEEYERAVGKFVDSMEAYPEGTFLFEEGDKVEITGGEFCGHPAIFEKEVNQIEKGTYKTTKITYRLKLEGIQNCSWVVELDPRQMTKITDEQFENLRKKLITETNSND